MRNYENHEKHTEPLLAPQYEKTQLRKPAGPPPPRPPRIYVGELPPPHTPPNMSASGLLDPVPPQMAFSEISWNGVFGNLMGVSIYLSGHGLAMAK